MLCGPATASAARRRRSLSPATKTRERESIVAEQGWFVLYSFAAASGHSRSRINFQFIFLSLARPLLRRGTDVRHFFSPLSLSKFSLSFLSPFPLSFPHCSQDTIKRTVFPFLFCRGVFEWIFSRFGRLFSIIFNFHSVLIVVHFQPDLVNEKHVLERGISVLVLSVCSFSHYRRHRTTVISLSPFLCGGVGFRRGGGVS